MSTRIVMIAEVVTIYVCYSALFVALWKYYLRKAFQQWAITSFYEDYPEMKNTNKRPKNWLMHRNNRIRKAEAYGIQVVWKLYFAGSLIIGVIILWATYF